MLIDNEKFIALLAENSGIEKEKVEKYLEELITDIKTAFDENEGYEVDGFGIFSKLGSNILFIPSEELATEINYKYVGMEPIELPGGEIQETQSSEEKDESPIQDIMDGAEPNKETEEYEDPFAELFNEAEDHENQSQEKEADDDDIEAAVEETIENEDLEEDVFNEILEDQEEEVETPSLVDEEIEEASEDEEKQEEKVGPDEWGIDAHKEDDQEDAFSGLLGEDVAESSELVDEDDIFASEEEIEGLENEEDQPEVTETEEEEEIDFSALEDNEDEPEIEDFEDDPFAELDEENEEEEFVPVVTNVSSGKKSKSKEKEDEPDEVDEDSSQTKKDIRSKTPRDRKQSSPVFLYMVLALVVLGGTGYILAYFGVVNIEGITPPKYKAQVAQNTPPVNQPNSTPPQINQAEDQTPVKTLPEITEKDSEAASPSEIPQSNNNTAASEPEQNESDQQTQRIPEENDLAPLIADEKAPGNGGIITPVNNETNAETYGLTGTVTQAGNNGFTIVLYTLSRKAGADAQFEKLSEDGYRAMIKEKPSEQYGVLYRVSIGQFKTLTDAAIAAEKIDSSILGNYIITKI